MVHPRSILLALLLPVLACACATGPGPGPSSSKRIMVVTSPPRATVSLIGNPTRLDSPCAVDLPSAGRSFLRVEKDGFEPAFVEVTSAGLDRGGEDAATASWAGDPIPSGTGYPVLRLTLKPSLGVIPSQAADPGPSPPAFQIEPEPSLPAVAPPAVANAKVKKSKPAAAAPAKAKPKAGTVKKAPRKPKAAPAPAKPEPKTDYEALKQQAQ